MSVLGSGGCAATAATARPGRRLGVGLVVGGRAVLGGGHAISRGLGGRAVGGRLVDDHGRRVRVLGLVRERSDLSPHAVSASGETAALVADELGGERSAKLATRPHMPPPMTTTSYTGSPPGASVGITQLAGGTQRQA